MIKKFYVTGDTHGDMSRFEYLEMTDLKEAGIIILGDAGCNFYKSKNKQHTIKSSLTKYACTFYLVRGNHEDRPENIASMETIYDEDIQGDVFYQTDYPNIRYLKDGYTYQFGKFSALVVGGAYSVDKWFRLRNHWTWYPEEQLTEEEMVDILAKNKGKQFDLVLTHTCPLSWEPKDLFITGINQADVDKTMEKWFDELKDSIEWDTWLFGHYHKDRHERPHVQMFYYDIESLENVWNHWHDENVLDPKYFPISPNYYKEEL